MKVKDLICKLSQFPEDFIAVLDVNHDHDIFYNVPVGDVYAEVGGEMVYISHNYDDVEKMSQSKNLECNKRNIKLAEEKTSVKAEMVRMAELLSSIAKGNELERMALICSFSRETLLEYRGTIITGNE